MPQWETIETERQGRVGIVRFNRPDRLNAINDVIMGEVWDAFTEFNADPDIGAIVTTGNGRAYSAGADLGARAAGNFGPVKMPPAHKRPFAPEFMARECKPLIAAVNGIALGIGMTSILWYDAIVASTEARFSMRFAALGLVPEVSSTWSLPRIVGIQNAKEMMLTGRIYSAQEARDMGLVYRLVEPDRLLQEAVALGEEIAANPSTTLRTIKEMTFRDFFAPDIEAVKENSGTNFAASRQTPEHREAVRAFTEKRTPRFHDVDYMRQVAEAMRAES